MIFKKEKINEVMLCELIMHCWFSWAEKWNSKKIAEMGIKSQHKNDSKIAALKLKGVVESSKVVC